MGNCWCLGLRWEILDGFRQVYGRTQASRSALYHEVLQQSDALIRQGLQAGSDYASSVSSENTVEQSQQQSCVTLGVGHSGNALDTHCRASCSQRSARFPVRRARGTVGVNQGEHETGVAAPDTSCAMQLPATRECWHDATPDVQACVHGSEEDGMPHLQAISASLLDEWRRHLLADHSPYRRDCATCVQARATGFKHKTVTHKNPATLSFDVAGPFKVKGKSVEGTVGRELPVRYLLVGSYRAPEIIFRPDVPEHPEPVENLEREEEDPLKLDVLPEDPPDTSSLSEVEDLDLPEFDDGRGAGSMEGLMSERDLLVKQVEDLQKPVEMKTAVAARAMTSRKKQEVLLHIQEMVIELRRYGLVVSQVLPKA